MEKRIKNAILLPTVKIKTCNQSNRRAPCSERPAAAPVPAGPGPGSCEGSPCVHTVWLAGSAAAPVAVPLAGLPSRRSSRPGEGVAGWTSGARHPCGSTWRLLATRRVRGVQDVGRRSHADPRFGRPGGAWTALSCGWAGTPRSACPPLGQRREFRLRGASSIARGVSPDSQGLWGCSSCLGGIGLSLKALNWLLEALRGHLCLPVALGPPLCRPVTLPY